MINRSFSQAFGDASVPHESVMRSAVATLGLSNLAPLIPFTKEHIKAAIESGDEHLNTLPIKEWDRAAGFVFTRTDEEEFMHRVPSGLTPLLLQHGINAYSCSQCVSLLKYAAKQIVKEDFNYDS